MAELCALPGVARKTANVVLGCAMGIQEGIVVDTHVARIAPLLGLTRETEPSKIELDLMAIAPREIWTKFAHGIIWHGRRVCIAKQPQCDTCTLAPLCPSAGIAVVKAQLRAEDATQRGVATRAANLKAAKAAAKAAKKKKSTPKMMAAPPKAKTKTKTKIA